VALLAEPTAGAVPMASWLGSAALPDALSALLPKAVPLGLCRAGTAGSQRQSMIQAGDVTQAGDVDRVVFGIILLLAFVPRLCDSVPEKARAKRAVGHALPGRDRGEEGRSVLKRGPVHGVGEGEQSFGCASLPPLVPLPHAGPARLQKS